MYSKKRAFWIADAILRNVDTFFKNERNRADFVRFNTRFWDMAERLGLRNEVAEIITNRARDRVF